jgi:uncharacterized protein (TIGR01615 family)
MYPNVFYLGEYEYIDVIMEGDRFLIDIDFRSEFEIARSTEGLQGDPAEPSVHICRQG